MTKLLGHAEPAMITKRERVEGGGEEGGRKGEGEGRKGGAGRGEWRVERGCNVYLLQERLW